MLTVIVEAGKDPQKLPALLAQLTAGAVEGLVRDLLIVAPREGLIAELCEETGAETADTLAAAVAQARYDLMLVLPSDLRLRDGWMESITGFVAGGGRAAKVAGLRGPAGVLVERSRAVAGRDLAHLRRHLGLLARRIG